MTPPLFEMPPVLLPPVVPPPLVRALRRPDRVQLPPRTGPAWTPSAQQPVRWPGRGRVPEIARFCASLGLRGPVTDLVDDAGEGVDPFTLTLEQRFERLQVAEGRHATWGQMLQVLLDASSRPFRDGCAEAAAGVAHLRFLDRPGQVETLLAHLLAPLRSRRYRRAVWAGGRPIPDVLGTTWRLVHAPAGEPAAWQAAACGRATRHTYDLAAGDGGLLWLLVTVDELRHPDVPNGLQVVGPAWRPPEATFATYLELSSLGDGAWDAAVALTTPDAT